MECHKCEAPLPAGARFCLQCGVRVGVGQDTTTDPLREALERAIGFQYQIERLLGRGGMGAVYLAHEFALDRDVAIKVLPPEEARTPQMRERFRREARLAARLNHPNIVPLYTFGEVDGLVYFVMGYVPGESLARRLERERTLPPDVARLLLADLAGALDYAHCRGIVHRDLKPDNILIDAASGTPLLTDFGVAKAPFGDGQLTTTGQILGTPDYMSPEQAIGKSDIDHKSDLYSFGIVAYQVLSGQLPFDGGTPVDALMQRLTQDPRPLRSVMPDVPDDLVAPISRCLQREPVNRWTDASTLRIALLPTDVEESDDTLALRLLRVSTAMLVVTIALAIYSEAFRLLDPAARGFLDHFQDGLAGMASTLFAILIGGIIALKRQKLDLQGILHAALLQPQWWLSRYPKRFRRREDVWDRLPPRIRRFRVQSTINMFVTLLIFLTMIGLRFAGHNIAAVWLLALFVFLPMVVIIERARTTKYVAHTFKITPSEASRILDTASWRTSVWLRHPAVALLRHNEARMTSGSPTLDVISSRVPVPPPDHTDTATQL